HTSPPPRPPPRRPAPGGLFFAAQAGPSSEPAQPPAGPAETGAPAPNSAYAVSKVAAASLVYYFGRKRGLRCTNLRLYSVYGPLEDASRLIPNVVRFGVDGRLPEFVSPDVSRDFVYVDDVTEAFIDAALNLPPDAHGDSFNIGTGAKTTIGDVATIARDLFGVRDEPTFTMPSRSWDTTDWFARIDKARDVLGWQPRTSFRGGLERTARWFSALPDKERYYQSSKRFGLDTKHSVSAIVACYRDGQAIPIMHERLRATFAKLNVDYEIIFVNDCR